METRFDITHGDESDRRQEVQHRDRADCQPEEASAPGHWTGALEILRTMLEMGGGVVSSMALKREFDSRGISNARDIVVQLKHFDFESPDSSSPGFEWRWHARSVYTPEAYQTLQNQQELEADRAAQAQEAVPESVPVRRDQRQEESRMGTYVVAALEDIYQSDWGPANRDYVFDVHSDRGGATYENVDVLAVDWRSDRQVELVTVEVKLGFCAKLVQQAHNYTRFSDRVWIAVPVSGNRRDTGSLLRDQDRYLFEYVVREGIGILACRRAVGRSYEIFPLHWPVKQTPDAAEKTNFIDRYRRQLEEAGALAPQQEHRYPRF